MHGAAMPADERRMHIDIAYMLNNLHGYNRHMRQRTEMRKMQQRIPVGLKHNTSPV